ncbi:hypothetical protein WMY93_013553 [Mugilogobius chulae]|uniref:BTB domain-containing protein n=1 Tax=Mugilogobius chulae TaxID=88201 RepID=A0AAW0PAE2_9GOBI
MCLLMVSPLGEPKDDRPVYKGQGGHYKATISKSTVSCQHGYKRRQFICSDGEIIQLNVGGTRFCTSRQTLMWIPDSFFSSLLSGRISTLRMKLELDPTAFAPILNFLRTKELDLSKTMFLQGVNISILRHEAEFYGITPLVRRLQMCEELDRSSCGSVLFHGYLPPPAIPARKCSAAPPTSEERPGPCGAEGFGRVGPLPHPTLTGTPGAEDSLSLTPVVDPRKVLIVAGHHNWIVAAYAHFVICYSITTKS